MPQERSQKKISSLIYNTGFTSRLLCSTIRFFQNFHKVKEYLNGFVQNQVTDYVRTERDIFTKGSSSSLREIILGLIFTRIWSSLLIYSTPLEVQIVKTISELWH